MESRIFAAELLLPMTKECSFVNAVVRRILILFAVGWCLCGWGVNVAEEQLSFQQPFINQSLDINHFELFFEDNIGRVWGGSYENGVMLFNGETFVRKVSNPKGRRGIHCSEYIGGDDYLVGAAAGLFVFNIRTLIFDEVKGLEHDVVKGLDKIDDETVVCFCEKKIVRYHIPDGTLEVMDHWDDIRLVEQIKYGQGRYFIYTDFFGIYTFDYAKPGLEKYEIAGLPYRREMLLDMILHDNTLWIGSDHRLYKYDLGQRHLEIVPELDGKTIKTIYQDSKKNVWVGTNNGLSFYNPHDSRWKHYQHSTKDSGSLLNDCVWCVYEDEKGNIWIGVDGGVSFIPQGRRLRYVGWNWNSESEMGNRISHVFSDSKGNYWLGGINGLSFHDIAHQQTWLYNTFGENAIPDNTIRCFYEDTKGVVWIGTDRGLSYYDSARHQFIDCMIVDRESGRSSVWTYGITEDKAGRFWVATCSGGVFCVDREALLHGGTVEALCNYSQLSKTRPIPNSSCMGIATTNRGDLWVRASQYVYQFKAETLASSSFPQSPVIHQIHSTTSLYTDGDTVYACRNGSLFKYINNVCDTIRLDGITRNGQDEIEDLAIGQHGIWLLTPRNVYVMNKGDHRLSSVLELSTSQYKCIYYDAHRDLIWLGGVDHCLVFTPKEGILHRERIDAKAILSEIYVNNMPLSPQADLNGRQMIADDVAFCDKIVLDTDENNLAFRFSTGSLFRELEFHTGYYYRIKELNPEWIPIRADNPLIEYSYLQHGEYHLEIGLLDEQSEKIDTLRTIDITIKAPWYQSWWFLLLLALLTSVIIIGVINHYRLNTKYRIAEIDRQKTVALSKMKMDFIADMSHELKTPLTLILGSVNNLLSSVKSSNTRTEIQTVEKNVRKMSAVISQIINCNENAERQGVGVSVGMGSEQLTTTKIEAVEFVRSIATSFKELCTDKGISLTFEADGTPVYVEIDPIKMESVVNNLLSNAYKFTPKGGTVKVGVTKTEAGQMSLTVSDTGTGIPEKDLQRVFDRFYQSEANQKENTGGSGIGLFMVRNFVEQHGGWVGVHSAVGKGSTFEVLLPLAEVDSSSPVGLHVPAADSNGISVLIVEDNIDIARYIMEGLKGMSCTVAHNGKSGLEKAQDLHPDIIITDVMMPIMNGEEMCRQLKRNLYTQHIPIIMLTAKDDRQTEREAYSMGVDAFISKPFDLKELAIRIRQLVSKSRQHAAVPVPMPDGLQSDENQPPKPTPDQRLMNELIALIEQHMDDSDFNVSALAELSNMNEKQLYRKVKQLVGMTPVDLIKDIRMKKASLLLKQKAFSVKEVMFMVGFTSQSYFAKCFTDHYGMSPREYMEAEV